MVSDSYDKVAKKFGYYHTGSHYTTVYPGEEPEKVFKENIIENSGKSLFALDLGCGDGRFIFSMAPFFKKIIGIDTSQGMLKAARKLQKELKIKNVELQKQDAFHTQFKDRSFDLIYSRRGPTPFNEVFRLLKPGGIFVVIRIGENDWIKGKSDRVSLFTYREVKQILSDFKILHLKQFEGNSKAFDGKIRYQHIIEFIAQKFPAKKAK